MTYGLQDSYDLRRMTYGVWSTAYKTLLGVVWCALALFLCCDLLSSSPALILLRLLATYRAHNLTEAILGQERPQPEAQAKLVILHLLPNETLSPPLLFPRERRILLSLFLASRKIPQNEKNEYLSPVAPFASKPRGTMLHSMRT